MKNATAQMNMTIEDHMKMMTPDGDSMKGMDMDMGDDSSMIEDDSEKKEVMPKGAHKMADGTIMLADGSTMSGTHIMEDGTTMTDSKMHTEMMHEGEDIEEHGSEEHGNH
ncbi:MAG: hypothetical protein Q9M97_02720 [Candidatus Gracilibacteria bacterium]|nr:hypothetical protein [Candidatus Gracilibacteria bacterium]